MTKLEIINLALIRIGESPITSLDEGSTAARTADLLYDASRRAILRDSDWNFAVKSVLLNPVDPDEAPAVFAVPADCLRVMRVYDKAKFNTAYSNTKTVEFSGPLAPDGSLMDRYSRYQKEWFKVQGSNLYTYARAPLCFYVRDEEDTSKFDAKFCEATSYKLAGELAMPVRQSESLMASMLNAYQNVVATAATETMNEHDTNAPRNPYVEVRDV